VFACSDIGEVDSKGSIGDTDKEEPLDCGGGALEVVGNVEDAIVVLARGRGIQHGLGKKGEVDDNAEWKEERESKLHLALERLVLPRPGAGIVGYALLHTSFDKAERRHEH